MEHRMKGQPLLTAERARAQGGEQGAPADLGRLLCVAWLRSGPALRAFPFEDWAVGGLFDRLAGALVREGGSPVLVVRWLERHAEAVARACDGFGAGPQGVRRVVALMAGEGVALGLQDASGLTATQL